MKMAWGLALVLGGAMAAAVALGAPASATAPAGSGGAETRPAEAGIGVSRSIKLADDGRFWNQGIVIDQQGQFAYLLGGQYTLIVEADTGKEVGKISTCWSNGVALAPEVGRGFVSTGQWGIIVFDLKTHKEMGKISVDKSARWEASFTTTFASGCLWSRGPATC